MSYSTKIPKKQIVAVSHHPEVAKGWKIYYKIRNSDSVISDTSYTLQIHLADGTLGTGRIWSFNSWKGQPGFLKVDIEGVGYHYVHPTRLKKIISKRTYRNKPTKPEVPFEDMGHTIFGE